ncbi:MAG: flagellar hook-associated protein FlgK [Calditrichaeota bacterium]|nr:MAG: flagellar hook-associated protein FlgK [Calditrichota bacterium]
MPGIFQSLDIARRALSASRLGLDVASHNIANVNTPGYSRQQLTLKAALPQNLIQGQLGMGVFVDSISRIRNQLLDFQFRRISHTLGRAEVEENVLLQVETVIQEPSESGIGNLMNEFFSEFSNLASEPENTAIRNSILQKATGLVESFRSKRAQLEDIQLSIRKDVDSVVADINNYARQIADLNQKIVNAEASGGEANDFRDQRDQLLDKLGELVEIRYREDENGNVTVSAAGATLVTNDTARELTVQTDSEHNRLRIVVNGPRGDRVKVESGRLGALLKLHNKALHKLIDRLDKLASTFIEAVNRQHRAGQGLPIGDPPASNSGLDFFVGTDAASIDVAPEIQDNVANIAASRDGTPGNGDVALAIANLRNAKLLEDRSQTLADYYNNTITKLGRHIDQARSTRENQELLREQVQNQREAESGVSLDEEMTQMIKFQRSLEASAKVIKVVDDILETLVNLV